MRKWLNNEQDWHLKEHDEERRATMANGLLKHLGGGQGTHAETVHVEQTMKQKIIARLMYVVHIHK